MKFLRIHYEQLRLFLRSAGDIMENNQIDNDMIRIPRSTVWNLITKLYRFDRKNRGGLR